MRPGRGVMTQTRLESWTASSMLWVTKTTVGRFCIHSACRSARIISRVMASSLPRGSSSRTVSGSCTMRLAEGGALLHAARQLVGARSSKPSRCTDRTRSSMRVGVVRGSRPRSSSCSSMLPRTVRQGTRVLSWNMMPMSVRGASTARR